jgi:hypothetical protein
MAKVETRKNLMIFKSLFKIFHKTSFKKSFSVALVHVKMLFLFRSEILISLLNCFLLYFVLKIVMQRPVRCLYYSK